MNKAINLSDKVLKKAKMELQFKNGLALILTKIDEEASEYHTNKDYEVILVFKTKAAIKKASEILGYVLEKKKTLGRFDQGQKAFKCRVNSTMYYLLIHEFNVLPCISIDGYNYTYENSFDSMYYSVELVPPHFKIARPGVSQYANVGSCAGGESLNDYIASIQNSIINGTLCLVKKPLSMIA